MTQVNKNYEMKYNTKRKGYKHIINLLFSLIALTGKNSIKKDQKTVYIGNNISLRQSTTNIYENMKNYYQYEKFDFQNL